MVDKVAQYADSYGMLDTDAVIVAVSGGADSMCLLDVLRQLAARRGFLIAAAHYNHGTRGSASDADEEFVHEWCRSYAIPLAVGRRTESPVSRHDGAVSENALRGLRYGFLEGLLEPGHFPGLDRTVDRCRIGTAHNADDNAETLLMRFHGIPPIRGAFIRPLLCATRDEINDYLRDYNVPHIEDASNTDKRYTRNRIRADVMPLLREINPQYAKHARAMGEKLAAFDELVDCSAWQFLSEISFTAAAPKLPRKPLLKLPRLVAGRVFTLAARELGARLYLEHVEAALRLASQQVGGKTLTLPGGITLTRHGNTLVFGKGRASGVSQLSDD